MWPARCFQEDAAWMIRGGNRSGVKSPEVLARHKLDVKFLLSENTRGSEEVPVHDGDARFPKLTGCWAIGASHR